MTNVSIKDEELRRAAGEGMDAFMELVVDKTMETVGGELNDEALQRLSADQVTLLAYKTLRDEVMDGGFVQLIYNGYGPFIFKNPFAKAIKLWGLRDLSRLVYDVHSLYIKYGPELTKECSDEDFMALFEQYPEFDDADDDFVEHEEEWTEMVARYIDENIEKFFKIDN